MGVLRNRHPERRAKDLTMKTGGILHFVQNDGR